MKRLQSILASAGQLAVRRLRALGALGLVLGQTARQLGRADRGELLRSLVLFGYGSLPLALLVAALAGATVVLQSGLWVERLGARALLGWAAGYSVLWEFGPLLLGLVMAARVGARNAAELASLTVGGQIEGLRGLSLDPFALLIAPRAWATLLSLGCLSLVASLCAILCEAVAAFITLRLPIRVFFDSFTGLLGLGDLLGGLCKALAYSLAIAVISTAVGLRAQGGSRGVGRAAASAVAYCAASIFALDFLLTPLLGRLLG